MGIWGRYEENKTSRERLMVDKISWTFSEFIMIMGCTLQFEKGFRRERIDP